jgi:hypothetical protein
MGDFTGAKFTAGGISFIDAEFAHRTIMKTAPG